MLNYWYHNIFSRNYIFLSSFLLWVSSPFDPWIGVLLNESTCLLLVWRACSCGLIWTPCEPWGGNSFYIDSQINTLTSLSFLTFLFRTNRLHPHTIIPALNDHPSNFFKCMHDMTQVEQKYGTCEKNKAQVYYFTVSWFMVLSDFILYYV